MEWSLFIFISVTYLVFDAPEHPGKYEERVEHLKTVINAEKETTYAAVVGIVKCRGVEHLKRTLAEVEKLGGEGLMLRFVNKLNGVTHFFARKPKSQYVNAR